MRVRAAAFAASLACSAAFAPDAARAAGPVDLFYERALMMVAGERCRLFSPQVTAALAVGAAQAKGAALRAGVQAPHLHRIEARARAKGAAEPCGSRDLQTAAARVNTGYEGWTRLTRMTFPGSVSAWTADRSPTRTVRWRLVQSVGDARFGLAGRGTEHALVAVADFGEARPYAARVVLRDPGRDAKPWLSSRPLPASAARAVWAEATSPAEATLLGDEADSGLAFRFPEAAAEALERLDSREVFHVEFLFQGRDGEKVRRVRFEVGDFAAGRAFVAARA